MIWESKPIKMGCTITIPWPCGGHQEVKGVDENGNGFFKAEAIIGTIFKQEIGRNLCLISL